MQCLLRQHLWALPAPPLPTTPFHPPCPSPALHSLSHSASLQGTFLIIILGDHRKGRKVHESDVPGTTTTSGKQDSWDSHIINTTPLWHSPDRTENKLISVDPYPSLRPDYYARACAPNPFKFLSPGQMEILVIIKQCLLAGVKFPTKWVIWLSRMLVTWLVGQLFVVVGGGSGGGGSNDNEDDDDEASQTRK